MVAILMMSGKNDYSWHSWNKGYDVTFFVQDITNKFLLREANYIVDVVIWPKFDNYSTSMRKVITFSIL